MHGTAHVLIFLFFVERIGKGQRVRIDLDHAVDCRAALVDFFDPGEIFFGDRARAEFSRSHSSLQVGDGELIQLEWFDRRRGRAGEFSRARESW